MQSCKLDVTVFVYLSPNNYQAAQALEAARWGGSGNGQHALFDAELAQWATVGQRMLTDPRASLIDTPYGPAVTLGEVVALCAVSDPVAWQQAGA
jgi:hypothetical protein